MKADKSSGLAAATEAAIAIVRTRRVCSLSRAAVVCSSIQNPVELSETRPLLLLASTASVLGAAVPGSSLVVVLAVDAARCTATGTSATTG